MSQTIFFVVKRRAESSVPIKISFGKSVSLLKLVICTINCIAKTQGIQWEKGVLNYPWVQLEFFIWLKSIGESSLAKPGPLLFSFNIVHALFILRALYLTGVRLWQILVKKMFQNLFRSLLNHLNHYTNKYNSVKPLSLNCNTSTLTNICLSWFPPSAWGFWRYSRF